MKFPIKNIITLTAALGALPAMAYDLGDYSLVWSDEFDGDTLDRSVWNVEVNGTGCGNHELQYYIDSPRTVWVKDGRLHLTAIPDRNLTPGGTHDFASGRINSKGKAAFRYGAVQASIRIPQTVGGLWPAFWMMGDDIDENTWPRCGELDILEMGHSDGVKAGTPDRLFNGAMHWGPGRHHQIVGPMTAPYSLQDGKFHTFTLVWDADKIEMYLDELETPYLTQDISGTDRDDAGYYFHKPAFILFNLAVGGDFPGLHSPDQITALDGGPRSLEVEYVRVYRKKGDDRDFSADKN